MKNETLKKQAELEVSCLEEKGNARLAELEQEGLDVFEAHRALMEEYGCDPKCKRKINGGCPYSPMDLAINKGCPYRMTRVTILEIICVSILVAIVVWGFFL